jgi:FkbM family methyltransferase
MSPYAREVRILNANVTFPDLLFAPANGLRNALLKKYYLNKLSNRVSIGKDIVGFRFLNKDLRFYFDAEEQLESTMSALRTVFVMGEYDQLNVKDSKVVDVGASIGDTAVFFAVKGAEHVYSFEPFPHACEIAARNIMLNDLSEKITFLNKACGDCGYAVIDEHFESSRHSRLRNFKKGKAIEIVNLSQIVESYKIDQGVLKIDCEGCEYDFLTHADTQTLRRFKQIILEYHYGYKNLEGKLRESGFRTQHTRPRVWAVRGEPLGLFYGLVYAEKG